MASNTMEEQIHQSSYKDKTLQITSFANILLSGCESRTLTADLERRMQASIEIATRIPILLLYYVYLNDII